MHVKELFPDGVLGHSLPEPGDIGEAVVEMSLVPIGPGGSETVLCTPVNDPAAFDYNGELTVECAFDDVKVNTYSVEATLVAGAGGLFYTGFADDVPGTKEHYHAEYRKNRRCEDPCKRAELVSLLIHV